MYKYSVLWVDVHMYVRLADMPHPMVSLHFGKPPSIVACTYVRTYTHNYVASGSILVHISSHRLQICTYVNKYCM